MSSQLTTTEKFPPPILSIPKQEEQHHASPTIETIIQERRELTHQANNKTDILTDITILGIIAVVAFIFMLVKGH